MTSSSQEWETLARNHQLSELDDDGRLADTWTTREQDVLCAGIGVHAASPSSPRHQKSPALSALPRATYDQSRETTCAILGNALHSRPKISERGLIVELRRADWVGIGAGSERVVVQIVEWARGGRPEKVENGDWGAPGARRFGTGAL